MTDLTLEQAKALVKIAEQNDGCCDRCHQTINIYKYKANRVMATILRRMARYGTDFNVREVDVDKLGLKHSERTQLTKMRFHGLVAKVKVNGVHKPRHWLITTKGWDWLRDGGTIQEKVIVFDNTLLGHEGAFITIKQALGEADFEQKPISSDEAHAYGQVREGIKHATYEAIYKGYSNPTCKKGETYTIKIERLQMGKPVKMTEPFETEYRDVAAFGNYWQVVKEVKE